jgi:hypothetical protein
MFSKLFQIWSNWRKPICCRRKLKGGERYRYFGKNFVFDVERANQIVLDGREPVELDEPSVRGSVEGSRICQEHVAHTDPTRPGIIAHVQCVADDGEVIKGHVLIDGNHRAARCLELGRPFYAYLLTEAESEAILKRKPEGTFPKVAERVETQAREPVECA